MLPPAATLSVRALIAGAIFCMPCVLAPAAADSADEPIVLHNQMWRCQTPQDGTVVTVVIDKPSGPDAVHLDAGCSGAIEVHLWTNSHDGIKIHAGARDLQLTGDITCDGRYRHVHQDGIQVMGGQHVLIGSRLHAGAMTIDCPTGNNGGVFVNAGRAQLEIPTDIVVDHADILEWNAAVHIGSDSLDAGVRNSVLHRGGASTAPDDCVRIAPDSPGAFAEDNVCLS